MEQKTGIKLEGHRGKFYVVDTLVKFGRTFYLLESEQYGEDAPWVAVDKDLNIILEDIMDGISELSEYLETHHIGLV